MTTNSPLSERRLTTSSNSAGVPRKYSSNFLVSSRASTTWRSGENLVQLAQQLFDAVG